MSKSKFTPWTIDPDAPQSINEMQLESTRIAAEVEKVRLQEETRQRDHRRMSGEQRAYASVLTVLLLVIGGIVAGFSVNGVENTRASTIRDQQRAILIGECARAGNEWKENLNGGWECLKP